MSTTVTTNTGLTLAYNKPFADDKELRQYIIVQFNNKQSTPSTVALSLARAAS